MASRVLKCRRSLLRYVCSHCLVPTIHREETVCVVCVCVGGVTVSGCCSPIGLCNKRHTFTRNKTQDRHLFWGFSTIVTKPFYSFLTGRHNPETGRQQSTLLRPDTAEPEPGLCVGALRPVAEQRGFCLWSPAHHSERAPSVQSHGCFLSTLEQ